MFLHKCDCAIKLLDLENIYMLNEKLKSATEKLVAKDKEVRTMKVTLDQCQEECKFIGIVVYLIKKL